MTVVRAEIGHKQRALFLARTLIGPLASEEAQVLPAKLRICCQKQRWKSIAAHTKGLLGVGKRRFEAHLCLPAGGPLLL
jgi:hypothetical protein